MGNRYKASTTGLHAGAKRGAPDPRWVVSPRHVLDPDISSPGGAMIVMYCIAFAALPKGFALLPPGSLSGWACLLAGGLLGPPSAPPFCFLLFPPFFLPSSGLSRFAWAAVGNHIGSSQYWHFDQRNVSVSFGKACRAKRRRTHYRGTKI